MTTMHRKHLLKAYHYFSSAYGVRLLIAGHDLMLVILSFFIALLLRHNFNTPSIPPAQLWGTLAVIGVVTLAFFVIHKTYVGVIRFTGEKDVLNIVKSVISSTLSLLVIGNLLSAENTLYLHNSILIINGLVLLVLMVGMRALMRSIYTHLNKVNHRTRPIAIFGAGACGNITRKAIESDNRNPMKVVAFFDDSHALSGKSLAGIKVYSPTKNFEEVIAKYKIEEVIIAIDKGLTLERKQGFVNQCLQHQVKVLTVPPVKKWLNNELQVAQIRKINIEDLLNRAPIQLHKSHIASDLQGQVVMITGAAGSIGSEISRQVAAYNPKKLILVDQAESPLWDHYLELCQKHGNSFLEAELADVRCYDRLEDIFQRHRPTFVYHAAAYKHVPILESFPIEAIKINVFGVKNMADLALKYGVKQFVFVSTDKAVNPTNVMGASKRIAEIYTQALNALPQNKGTKFITTRFGNVLGSNGSVVPLFTKQIEQGGPITVTHQDIIRYFMTIPEACQLVLEAGSMGKGGEIFVFDMGDPVRISDLAKKMIQLAGLKEGVDINIVYTGLREGEKLYEELLSAKEDTMPTHHEKIMIGKAKQEDYYVVEQYLQELKELSSDASYDPMHIVALMKQIVPEFISNASRYEVLDKQSKIADKQPISQ